MMSKAKSMRFAWSLALVAGLCLTGAPTGRAADKAAKTTYDEHVVPILREKCFGCHNPDRKSGGLRLNTYTNIMGGGASGEVIKPGDPDGSLLFRLVSHLQEPNMPPKSPKLPDAMLATIRAWIQGGALENSGSKAVAVNKPKFDIALSSIAKGKPDGPPPMPEKLGLEPVVRTKRANALTALAASPWATLVAVAGQKQVILYHADTLELLGILPFPEGVPYVLKFSRNGSLLLAGGGKGARAGKVVVWSVKTGERIFEVGDEMDAVLAADISADQTQIALGGPSKVVRIYSTTDGKLLQEIKKHTDWIYALEFSPDGVLLASGDRNGGLLVWEAHTAREYFSLRGHTAAITDVSWRADSNVVASASEDGTIRLWEMENGTQIKGWGHGAAVEAVKYARDGRLVSCGRDNRAKVWDQNGASVRVFDPFPDIALRAVFTHDGNRVIAGDWTGQLRVLGTADGKLAGNLEANPPSVAEQLARASKELGTKEAQLTQLTAAAAASQTAADAAARDLTAAQKASSETAATAQNMATVLARAREVADRASGALATAQAQTAAHQITSQAYTEAAAKIKTAADKAKDNKELASAVVRGQQIATQAAADLAAAQKLVADLTPVARTASEQLAQVQKEATAAAGAAAASPKVVESKAAAAKAAAARAAAEKAAAVEASQAIALIKARVEKFKSALPTKTAQK
jgi:hypothetical protein